MEQGNIGRARAALPMKDHSPSFWSAAGAWSPTDALQDEVFVGYNNSLVKTTLVGVNPSGALVSGHDGFNALAIGEIGVSN